MSLIIGVDYGRGKDESAYTIGIKNNGNLLIVDSGKIENFNFEKYANIANDIKIYGEPLHVRRFKDQFKI